MEKSIMLELSDQLTTPEVMLSRARSVGWVLTELIFTDRRVEQTFTSYSPQIIKDLLIIQDDYTREALDSIKETIDTIEAYRMEAYRME